ncbi:hypothetical protein WJX73_002416 [Symbiochloris irregularis]|uniref:Uncharacterized protein n=1 Tax=Symbiochloris irregularis TaxID=706552 RepID=A0AAW1NVQ2_9CHLO
MPHIDPVTEVPGRSQESRENCSFQVPSDFAPVAAPCSLACSDLSKDQELWLLQLPLSWQQRGSITVSSAQNAAREEIWTCQDDSGSRFRLVPEDASIATQHPSADTRGTAAYFSRSCAQSGAASCRSTAVKDIGRYQK